MNAHLCYEPLIWPTKPHGPRLAARSNDRQRRSRTIAGRSLWKPSLTAPLMAHDEKRTSMP
ncbi:hypothetical protein CT690_16120 [Serratia plymuthica]|uniref:Uncharacterized protein n=1 Tax=Serratia plymuthica TaxID=82996 RepID=A0A318P8N3_SERPL|nr:hypothetical protein CT690_16120 [Serratia plymuthica]